MNLSIKILISLIIAVITGVIAGPGALPFIKWWIAPIGTMFINLIKMMIVPVVFTSLIVGVTSLGDTKKLGRIGLKTLVLYLLTTAIAIIIGFAVAGVSHPGVGMHITNGTVQAAKAAPSIMQVILDMIPSSPVQSMAKSDILPVIVFALFIGVGIVNPHVASVFAERLTVLPLRPACPVDVFLAFAPQSAPSTIAERFAGLLRDHFRALPARPGTRRTAAGPARRR